MLHAPGNRIPLAGDGGTVSASTPLLNLTQAWSGTGTFTLDFANVTADPGPSNAASLLIDRQYLGASQFKVTRGGSATFNGALSILGGNLQIPAAQFFRWAGSTLISTPADGVVLSQTSGAAQLTVGTLPTAAAGLKGARAMVTDANASTFNSVVAAGGANIVPVFCDGTSWRIG